MSNEDLIKVFTGSEMSVKLLQSNLAEIGIEGIFRNEMKSAVKAGFGALPMDVDFYIRESDFPKAKEVLNALAEGK